MSKEERTGWRDKGLSFVHREFGYNFMVDLDFVAIEYSYGYHVKALIEYKNEHSAWSPEKEDKGIPAIKNLADMAGVPFFVVKYTSDYLWWDVYPQNDAAVELCGGGETKRYKKKTFKKFLDRLPRRVIPISQNPNNPL